MYAECHSHLVSQSVHYAGSQTKRLPMLSLPSYNKPIILLGYTATMKQHYSSLDWSAECGFTLINGDVVFLVRVLAILN